MQKMCGGYSGVQRMWDVQMGVVGRQYNVQKGVDTENCMCRRVWWIYRKFDVQKGVVDIQKIRCVEGCGKCMKKEKQYIYSIVFQVEQGYKGKYEVRITYFTVLTRGKGQSGLHIRYCC